MSFGKNYYQINKYPKRFGKNIIITSHHDWDTDEIVRASLDGYKVEDAFRQTKAGPQRQSETDLALDRRKRSAATSCAA